MGITAQHPADVADRLALQTEPAIDDARSALASLERFGRRLREISSEIEDLELDDRYSYPFVMCRLPAWFREKADEVAELDIIAAVEGSVISDVGEFIRMLRLGVAELRRTTDRLGDVAEVAR